MKKLYFFSKSKLQYVHISREMLRNKSFLRSFLALPGAVVVFISVTIIGFSIFSGNESSIKKENSELKEKLDHISVIYTDLNKKLDSLENYNNELRVAVNLPALSSEEQKVGVGGGYFNNSLDFSSKELRDLTRNIDEISRKIEFEKNNFNLISNKIEENKKLFAAMPAIKPCTGVVTEHGFGMRMHPILKINLMHEGLDIVTDIGTPVHVSGNGTVDFVGYKGGYGLCIEVDHGFGYRTLYGHLSAAKVKLGQSVNRGDLIAETGNTGLSSGPHLHYEVSRDGIKQDPSYFFFDEQKNSNLVKNDGR